MGPRPPVTYHPYDGYQNYPQWAKKRFELLPGLTGLAQVELKSDATWDERITVDVRYVENFSVRMDILILLRTVIAVFKRDTF